MDDPTQEDRDAAAASYLETEDATSETYDDALYAQGSHEYLVLTDEEADERATDYIRDSLWAFNTSFLIAYVPDGLTEDVLAMIGEKCEDGNDSMLALVGENFDRLASHAISADGRAHFLATYDGNEDETEVAGRTWYVYRTN